MMISLVNLLLAEEARNLILRRDREIKNVTSSTHQGERSDLRVPPEEVIFDSYLLQLKGDSKNPSRKIGIDPVTLDRAFEIAAIRIKRESIKRLKEAENRGSYPSRLDGKFIVHVFFTPLITFEGQDYPVTMGVWNSEKKDYLRYGKEYYVIIRNNHIISIRVAREGENIGKTLAYHLITKKGYTYEMLKDYIYFDRSGNNIYKQDLLDIVEEVEEATPDTLWLPDEDEDKE